MKDNLIKINYWMDKLLKASNDSERESATENIKYFQNRHKEVYGSIPTIWEMSYGEE